MENNIQENMEDNVQEKALTLKGLEKDVKIRFEQMENYIKLLEHKIAVISKALKR